MFTCCSFAQYVVAIHVLSPRINAGRSVARPFSDQCSFRIICYFHPVFLGSFFFSVRSFWKTRVHYNAVHTYAETSPQSPLLSETSCRLNKYTRTHASPVVLHVCLPLHLSTEALGDTNLDHIHEKNNKTSHGKQTYKTKPKGILYHILQ